MATHGDDLDDDFVIDESLVVLSDGEPIEEAPQKRKRKDKQRERKTKKLKFDVDPMNKSWIKTDYSPEQLFDYLAAKQIRTFSKMSTIELEPLAIPKSSIVDTTTWTAPRTLDHLLDFILSLPILPTRLSQRSKDNGAPTLLFISPAALRVIDITRVLKSTQLRGDKGADVAKLFSRHIKLSDHVSYLRRTKVGAAVGTPSRIGKLLAESDALSVSALTHIILDLSFRDAKDRNLLDIPETRDELLRTILAFPPILKAIKDAKIQIIPF